MSTTLSYPEFETRLIELLRLPAHTLSFTLSGGRNRHPSLTVEYHPGAFDEETQEFVSDPEVVIPHNTAFPFEMPEDAGA